MEELLTTEVLDREILEDARKKAFKILKSADDGIQSLSRRWERKTRSAVDEIRRNYEKRTQDERDEITAKSPLDKRRLRLEISEKFLVNAMDQCLQNTKREDILLILERELRGRLASCTDVDFTIEKSEVSFQNMNEKEARAILDKTMPAKNFQITGDSKTSSVFPGLIINTRSIRIAVSVYSTALQLLKINRAELASALLGMDALND